MPIEVPFKISLCLQLFRILACSSRSGCCSGCCRAFSSTFLMLIGKSSSKYHRRLSLSSFVITVCCGSKFLRMLRGTSSNIFFLRWSNFCRMLKGTSSNNSVLRWFSKFSGCPRGHRSTIQQSCSNPRSPSSAASRKQPGWWWQARQCSRRNTSRRSRVVLRGRAMCFLSGGDHVLQDIVSRVNGSRFPT